MRLIKYTLLSLSILILTAQFCFAQESNAYKKEYKQDSLDVNVTLDSSEVSIAKPFDVVVTVSAPENIETDISFESNDNFELKTLRRTKVSSSKDSSLVQKKYTIVLSPKTVGKLTIDNIVLNYSDKTAHDTDKKMQLEPIAVTVVGFLSDKDYQQIDDKGAQSYFDTHIAIEGNEKLPFSKKTLAIIAVLVLLVVAAIVVFLRRTPAPEQEVRITMNAREIASRLFDKLDHEPFIKNGEYKVYYQNLSNILRYYIEYRFGINAPDKTTEEFFQLLRGDNILDAITKSELKDFLTHCDMVKFAKHIPSLDDMESARKLASEFVDKTYDSELNVDITNDVKIRELLGL